ncbi:MAG: hypothetical protein V1853_03640 [bacterium]
MDLPISQNKPNQQIKEIKITPKERELKTPAQRKKALVFLIIGFAVSFGFWWSLNQAFSSEQLLDSRNVKAIVLSFVLFGASLGFLGLAATIIKSFTWGSIYIVASTIISLVFFPANLYWLLGWLLIGVAWARYWSMVAEETEHRIRFSLIKSFTHGLGTVLTVTIIGITLMYLGVASDSSKTSDKVISNMSESAGDAVLVLMEKQLPDFERTMTVDTFLSSFGPTEIFSTLPEDFLPEDVIGSLIPDDELKELETLDATAREAAISEARNQLLAPLGLEVDGDQTMEVVVYELINKKLQPLIERYEKFIPPMLALALLSALSIFGALYYWWATLWAHIWYGILRLFHWVSFEEETRKISRALLSD